MKSIDLFDTYDAPVLHAAEFEAEQGYASSSNFGFSIKMSSSTLN